MCVPGGVVRTSSPAEKRIRSEASSGWVERAAVHPRSLTAGPARPPRRTRCSTPARPRGRRAPAPDESGEGLPLIGQAGGRPDRGAGALSRWDELQPCRECIVEDDGPRPPSAGEDRGGSAGRTRGGRRARPAPGVDHGGGAAARHAAAWTSAMYAAGSSSETATTGRAPGHRSRSGAREARRGRPPPGP